METIYKYEFDIDDEVKIDLPEGAQILSVQDMYPGIVGAPLTLWARVNTENDVVPRLLKLFGTGHPVDDRLNDRATASNLPSDRYVGTVVTSGGMLVWHVYEVLR